MNLRESLEDRQNNAEITDITNDQLDQIIDKIYPSEIELKN